MQYIQVDTIIVVVILCSKICEKLNFCVVKYFTESVCTSIFALFKSVNTTEQSFKNGK